MGWEWERLGPRADKGKDRGRLSSIIDHAVGWWPTSKGLDRAEWRRRSFSLTPAKTKPQVRKLYADLKARGFDPWLDEVDLLPGQIWKTEIPKAIRQAGIFLACLSSRSVGKVGYVQNEFRLALSAFGERPPGSIFLIPVRLDDCDVPDLQIPDRGLSLRDIHWVDLWQEGGFDRLVSAIEHALGGAPDPRRARERERPARPSPSCVTSTSLGARSWSSFRRASS